MKSNCAEKKKSDRRKNPEKTGPNKMQSSWPREEKKPKSLKTRINNKMITKT